MPDSGLILTLAGGLTAALLFGYVTHRLGLSPIAGYLLAGVLVGPHTPGFVANSNYADQLSAIGVILLLFSAGLQFHIEDLVAMRGTAIPGAIVGMATATLAGAGGAHALGWPWLSATMFGLTLSMASTAVLVRVLSDLHQLHTRTGHMAMAWLVVEDILTVLVLVLLPTLARPTLTPGALVLGGVVALAKVVALGAVAIPIGRSVVPRVLDLIAATRSRELFTLAVLVLALGVAVISAFLFGVSIALGAFVAGLVVGRSDYNIRASGDALPLRDAFAALFFMSVGMLLNPGQLWMQVGLVLIGLFVVLVAKPVAAMLTLFVLRHPARAAVAVPAAVAQIGEFSFILANLGRELRLIPDTTINVIVAVSFLTIIINPVGARLLPRTERWFARFSGRPVVPRREDEMQSSSLAAEGRAVVVGYGPTGRTVSRLLRENGIAPTIVELNIDTVRDLRQENVSAVYGDARLPETLVLAGVRHAATLIVSGASPETTEVVRRGKELNPRLRVLARAAYIRELPALRAAGVEEAFSGEGEVALAMTEAVLRRLRATPDQIDRERARVRRDLFGSS